MLLLNPIFFEDGFRELNVGEFIKTTDQWFDVVSGKWKIGQWYTSQKQEHKGKVPYRRAVTKKTKIYMFYRCLPKIFKGIFIGLGRIWRL